MYQDQFKTKVWQLFGRLEIKSLKPIYKVYGGQTYREVPHNLCQSILYCETGVLSAAIAKICSPKFAKTLLS